MTTEDAVDEMMGIVKAALPVDCAAIWPGTPATIPEGDWIRATVRHASGGQASLAGENGARRFKRIGTLIVQCFSPVGDGNMGIDQLSFAFQAALENVRSSPVWLRNVRSIEMGKDGTCMQTNVMADFEYDHFH